MQFVLEVSTMNKQIPLQNQVTPHKLCSDAICYRTHMHTFEREVSDFISTSVAVKVQLRTSTDMHIWLQTYNMHAHISS